MEQAVGFSKEQHISGNYQARCCRLRSVYAPCYFTGIDIGCAEDSERIGAWNATGEGGTERYRRILAWKREG